MKKLLSLVINIANDNYYEDLIFRIQKTLDFNLFFLNKLNQRKKVEIIYVDWGSKDKISNLIYVNRNFTNQVKFINVNENLAKKNSIGYPNNFNHDISYNIGFRRSSGKHILQTAADQFFTSENWLNLLNCLEKKNFLKNEAILIPRKIIENKLYDLNLDAEKFERILLSVNSTNYKYKSHTFYNGGGFSTLLTKKNFFKLRGYNEKMSPGTSSDGEFAMRYNLLDLDKYNSDNFGVYMYKFPPLEGSLRNKLVYSNKLRKNPTFPTQYSVNDKNWGLKNINLKKIKSKKKSDNFKNYKFYENKLPKYKTDTSSIYKKLIQSKNLYLNNFENLKNISLILNLISNYKIYSFIEFGFKDPMTIDLVGSNFKFLNILSIDYSKKNKNLGYLNRTGKINQIFNFSRYGAYKSIFPRTSKELYKVMNNYLKPIFPIFLTINYNDDLFCRKLFTNFLAKKKITNNLKIILILNYNRKNKNLNRSLIKLFNLYHLDKKNILLINKKIDQKNFFIKSYSNLNKIIPYTFYIFHKLISVSYIYLRSFIYGFIK